MKILGKLLKDKRKVIFFDLEGTQSTSEIIAIGAIKVTLDAKYNINKVSKGFETVVKSQGKVGFFVEKLTGLTDEIVSKQGVSYEVMMKKLLKYIGKDINDYVFVAYGNYDKTMFIKTDLLHNNIHNDFINIMCKNYVDFSKFISQFMKKDGQTYSLIEAIIELNGHPVGKQHSALDDTRNLIVLYESVIKNKVMLEQHYRNYIKNDPRLPKPILNVIKKLDSGQNVSPKDFEQYIKDYLN